MFGGRNSWHATMWVAYPNVILDESSRGAVKIIARKMRQSVLITTDVLCKIPRLNEINSLWRRHLGRRGMMVPSFMVQFRQSSCSGRSIHQQVQKDRFKKEIVFNSFDLAVGQCIVKAAGKRKRTRVCCGEDLVRA